MPIVATADVTWVNPSSVQLNAQELRRADAALMGGDGSAFGVRGGVVRHGDASLAVTVSASDVLTVQPGPVVIPANNGVGNAAYRTALGAAAAANLDARNATNPRLDRVVFQVLDTDVLASTGGYIGQVQLLTGGAAATPVLPDLPTLAVELARLSVPAQGGGAVQVDSSFRSFFTAPGSRLIVTTAARLPSNAATRERALVIDTGLEYVFVGGQWSPVQQQGTSATTGSGISTSATVTFPAPFLTAPVIQVTPSATPGGDFLISAMVTSKSATGFTVRQRWSDGATHGGSSFDWIATAS